MKNGCHLCSTNLTDDGRPHVTGLENLRQLNIWKTAATKDCVAKLKKALPDLTVTGLAKQEIETKEESESNEATEEQKVSATEASEAFPSS